MIRPITLLSLVGIMLHPIESTKAADTTSPIPDHILYEVFFRHIISLDQFGSALQAKRKDPTFVRSKIKNAAKLSDSEEDTVKQIAASCLASLLDVYKQRGELLKAGKAAHSFSLDVQQQVMALQTQRENIVKHNIKQLKQSLGEKSFAALDSFIRATETRHITIGTLPSKDKQH